MIKNLAFVAYSVADVPRSVAFYRDVVGLKLDDQAFEKSGGHWAEFQIGEATFGFGNGTSLGIEPGSQVSAAFETDDIHAMRGRLLGQNVVVGELMESPVCTSCFVTDPDGNRFALHQLKK
jgi:predicted enzyme related to lactoylglutathione lyase